MDLQIKHNKEKIAVSITQNDKEFKGEFNNFQEVNDFILKIENNTKRRATIYDMYKMCTSAGDCYNCPLSNLSCFLGIAMTESELDKINQVILKWVDENNI